MKEQKNTSLLGLYIHTFDRGFVLYQGRIVGRTEGLGILVELYSWLLGDATYMKMFPESDVCGWRFYDVRDYWKEEGDLLFKLVPPERPDK